MRKAAYFQLREDYFGRAFDDNILGALGDAGFEVDVYAPDGAKPQSLYPNVTRTEVQYRRAWLQRNRGLARRYNLFLGTADIPMAFAGSLAALGRKPSMLACDEIFVGGYEGHARSYWKSITKWAMRRADFTIITDEVRIPLQREYAHLPANHPFLQSPCCFGDPIEGVSRDAARRQLGIGPDEFVVSFTGAFTSANGVDWLVRLLDADPNVRLLIQTGGAPDAVLDALLARLDRVHYLPERLEYRESMRLTAAADVGAVFYLSPKPQFQHMGVSSQKLCAYLRLGIPVVATRQASFVFIEDFRCGELIAGEHDLTAALGRVRANRDTYSRNATRALDEYVRPLERRRALKERFARL